MTSRTAALRLPSVAIVAALALSVSPALAHATPERKRQEPWQNHCLTPFGGYRGGDLVDLNELLGRSQAFVHPRHCPQVDAGERWMVGRGCTWITNGEHGNYPAGYVPSGGTPMEDFLSKLTVKVVVDAGTNRERTYLYRYADDPSVVAVIPAGQNPWGDGLPLAALIPANPPLPIGRHVVDAYIVLSAEHWDGLGTDPSVNRLPAGETPLTERNAFEVVPRSGSASETQ